MFPVVLGVIEQVLQDTRKIYVLFYAFCFKLPPQFACGLWTDKTWQLFGHERDHSAMKSLHDVLLKFSFFNKSTAVVISRRLSGFEKSHAKRCFIISKSKTVFRLICEDTRTRVRRAFNCLEWRQPHFSCLRVTLLPSSSQPLVWGN